MSGFRDELAEAFVLYSQLLDRAAEEAVWEFLTTKDSVFEDIIEKKRLEYFGDNEF